MIMRSLEFGLFYAGTPSWLSIRSRSLQPNREARISKGSFEKTKVSKGRLVFGWLHKQCFVSERVWSKNNIVWSLCTWCIASLNNGHNCRSVQWLQWFYLHWTLLMHSEQSENSFLTHYGLCTVQCISIEWQRATAIERTLSWKAGPENSFWTSFWAFRGEFSSVSTIVAVRRRAPLQWKPRTLIAKVTNRLVCAGRLHVA